MALPSPVLSPPCCGRLQHVRDEDSDDDLRVRPPTPYIESRISHLTVHSSSTQTLTCYLPSFPRWVSGTEMEQNSRIQDLVPRVHV